MTAGRGLRAAPAPAAGWLVPPDEVRDRLAARSRRAPVEVAPGAVGRGEGGRAGDAAGLAVEVRDVAAGRGRLLGVADLVSAASVVSADLWGLGPLEGLVAEPGVTDVLVNGGGAVWVDRGRGVEAGGLHLGDEATVRALAVRLAASAGRRLDEGSPWVDARLGGGLRLHAVLPPLAPEGTHLSLRVLRRSGWTLDGLVESGAVAPRCAEVLEALVATRSAFLVSGGTGAGKTTLLAALLALVPAGERLVVVEDVGELGPLHPHVVRLEARPANVEGRGGVGLADLVRQALRMRPDRIVVGECRGAEVRELLAALNTGHAGGCGTVHANSAREVPARLEALGALAGMSPESVRLQARAALDAVVHVRRGRSGRWVSEIGVVDEDARVRPALLVEGPSGGAAAVVRDGPGWPALAARLGLAG